MANEHSTFPEGFGYWISGFVAGEGAFCLGRAKEQRPFRRARDQPYCHFRINLRYDDLEILKTIQAYWQCGKVGYRSERRRDNPQATFKVIQLSQLRNIVIPHFKAYPLHAKKTHDFIPWCEAVELCYQVSLRKKGTVRGMRRGQVLRRWLPEDFERFDALVKSVRSTREYRLPDSPLPGQPAPRIEPPTLFD